MKIISKQSIILLVLPLFFISCAVAQPVKQAAITPETALKAYLNNGDKTFDWKIVDSLQTEKVTTYNLLLTSQKWQGITWVHQLTIFIPAKTNYDGALLFISGGSVRNGKPGWKKPGDPLNLFFSGMSTKNKAVVAILSQTPNQPLYGLTEDALISKTLHDFKNDKDYSKPLLFPMVKSAVRAMDAIQQFMSAKQHQVIRFVVSGASKRGWTTWLTGAVDDRVAAIAPMVIDILNMPKSLAYQVEAFGKYSEQINDYVKLGILEDIRSETGEALVTMIDPYSYRKSLDMPKMLFMGTNDEYWVVDNVKNYLHDMPGTTLLHYVPNAGHNLGGGLTAFAALSAFFGITLNNGAYPKDSWKTSVKNGIIEVEIEASQDILTGTRLWYANSRDRDFRDARWESRDLNISGKAKFTVTEKLPATGYHAFYVDLLYQDPRGGTYTVSTRVFMTDTEKIL